MVCAGIAPRGRARREQAATPAALALLLLAAPTVRVEAQGVPPRPDTARVRADSGVQGRSLDTATARRLGLPTGPTRSFPPSDAVIDSLLKLKGFRVTRYVADTVLVEGDSAISLWGQAFVDRDGTKLESDSIRYKQASCRLDATGGPHLFDQSTVLVGEVMRYDTCIRRGTVSQALTRNAPWYIRGDLAVDSGSTRLYGARSEITSDDNPVPDYHFGTHQVKWLSKSVMVGRPAVLYIRDVPIMWLPFIFQDIRPGRRSGILVPRFGLNDLVRPTRNYQRHMSGLGYYFVVNDYVDLLVSGDWYAGRYMSLRTQTRYRWLDRFVTGGLSFSWDNQLDVPAHSIHIGWQHQQSFSSRTNFSASVNYSTNPSVIQNNTVNPFVATASLVSQLNFSKQFNWGTLNIGGSRSQDIGNGLVSQSFPTIGLTPSPVNITPSITWSPGFSFSNQQTFHQADTRLLVPGDSGVPDTLAVFADSRVTHLGFQTPLRIGPWNWSNSFDVNDQISSARKEFVSDTPSPGGARGVITGQTFETRVEWQTGINLPSFFTGTWKLQPGLAIVNTTTAGPFAIRNQFTGGQWLHQGKRLAFTAGVSPTFFGFFPRVGPLQRIRHSISPIVSYFFAPGATVGAAFAHAVDPTGTNPSVRSDPQQTISLGLSQNFEAKLKPPPRGVAGRRLELGLEVLGEAEADRLLRVAAHARVRAGRIDGVRERRSNRGARREEVADDRRNRVPDTLQRPYSGEEAEKRGRHARREGEPLPLVQPLAARELVADRERSCSGRIHDRQPRLELPGPREKRRQVDPGLPFDPGFERLAVQHAPRSAGRRGVVHKLFSRAADLVVDVEAVRPVPRPDPQGRLKDEVRHPTVGEHGQRVRHPGVARDEQARVGLVKRLLVAEGEARRPGDRWCDVHR